MMISISPAKRVKTLVLILAFTILPPIISDLVIMIMGQHLIFNLETIITTAVFELVLLGIVLYVLIRQGRNIASFGLDFKLKDIATSLGLFLIVLFVMLLLGAVLSPLYYVITGHIFINYSVDSLTRSVVLWFSLFSILNAVFEELIVRAYTMTEIEALTKSKNKAIAASALLQASYHIYQGVLPVVILVVVFLIFSNYYAKQKRITPVILAHLYLDLFVALLVSFTR